MEYLPTAPGEYAVHVLANDEDIPNSPYVPIILSKTDYEPEKVTSSGPGLEKNAVVAGKPVEFAVDTRKAGGKKAPLDVSVMSNADYKNLPVKITDNKDGTYKVQYTPDKTGKHTVHVNYGGVSTTNSPYRIQVHDGTRKGSDASKTKSATTTVKKVRFLTLFLSLPFYFN